MDQNTNPPSNPNPATPPVAGQNPGQTPVTPSVTNPGQPTTPPTPPATGTPNPNPAAPQQPGQTGTPPTPPANTSKKGMIIAIVVFLVLLVAAAAMVLTQPAMNEPEQQPTPSTSVENTAPTLVPTQSVEEEIDAVDTGASESSDLEEVEEDINSLQPTTPVSTTTTP